MVFGVCASTWVSVALKFASLKGKSSRLHGHDYQVTVCVEGPLDSKSNLVIDYYTLDDLVRKCVGLFDHKDLREVLGVENPSAELLAERIGECTAKNLPHGLRVAEVRVCSPIGFCAYYRPTHHLHYQNR
jgi:6-pyruvoyltetrahydropterin/6-carboxytetrahydropterin synthase